MLATALLGMILASFPEPPLAQEPLAQVSAETCRTSVAALTGFGTRHTLSVTDSPTRGIGAARTWLASEFRKHAALQVRTEDFDAPKMPRLPEGARIVNVVATLPGTMPQAARRVVYVVGHYDSINADVLDPAGEAPGANDDASGTAVVLECARIASTLKLDCTVVFLATCAEEQGLVGAKFHVQALAAAKAFDDVYVLNNDIVGDPSVPFSVLNAAPLDSSTFVRVFSEAIPRNISAEELTRIRNEGLENDSPSRQLARYVVDVARRENLIFQPRLIFRQDRFLRGGDHSAFNEAGFPAIRFSVPAEDYTRQHANITTVDGKLYGDTAQHVDPAYIANVARLNLAALIHLANAPSAPARAHLLTRTLTANTTLAWKASPEPDVAGYEIVVRDTTSSNWQTVIDVGNVTTHTLAVSKDNSIFGVRAYDSAGYRSVVNVAVSSRE